jgi:anthranilate synthase component 1
VTALPGVVAAGRRVTVVREVVLDGETPISAFARLHRGQWGFLLESLEGGERWARYTFLATEPREVLRYRGRTAESWTAQSGWRVTDNDVDPLEHLAARVRAVPPVDVPGLPRFTGGAVGWLGYDLVRTIERLPSPPPDDRGLPDAVVMLVDTLLVLDNLYQRAFVVSSVDAGDDGQAAAGRARDEAAARIEELLARLRSPSPRPLLPLELGEAPALPAETSFPAGKFEAAVRRVLEYIAAGDTFQTVLSRRLDLPAPDAFLAYRYLRALNPAPYLYYLHCDDVEVAGSSPEVLVRVEGGEVTVRPIAGTRPRGATPADDLALEAELRADPKERAEHLMLVDLGRNDVGRVARYGSVEVRQLMAVERYSHVMHLVSEVRGRLRDDLDAIAALRACFPAGTVSGAPKVRAMEIIDELEPVRRGPYAGAVGYLGWGAASLDTAIAIRTAVFHGGRAWVQAGAGIVADSSPEAELRECDAKAGAVLAALALASRAGQSSFPLPPAPSRSFPPRDEA